MVSGIPLILGLDPYVEFVFWAMTLEARVGDRFHVLKRFREELVGSQKDMCPIQGL